MIYPSLSDYKMAFQSGGMIAAYETFPADLETPVSAFLKLAQHEKDAFLLESAVEEQKLGRYSILGIHPEEILEAKNGRITLIKGGRKSTLSENHILNYLEEEIRKNPASNEHLFPGFPGGYIGYFSYENVRDFEKVAIKNKHPRLFPDAVFFRVHEFLVFDHYRKTLSIVVQNSSRQFKSAAQAYAHSCKRIKFYEKKLKTPLQLSAKSAPAVDLPLKANFSQKGFETIVKKAKEYIRAGDIIQVVLSQRFESEYKGDDFQIYRSLRSINPSPYMFYFRADQTRLVGSSPEVLVKKTGRIAELRPIAGTRPRGKTETEDMKFEKQLRSSKKELAEHVMLVDLGRNDLGRVSDFKSVRVKDYAHVERYSHVMHLVSNVCSVLKKGKTAGDLLRAVFPAGTVSGAPKIRAMEIIDELERDGRGPYAGCLGYLGFNGDMDMCITIRTLMCQGKHLCLQAGAGIVKDSNPTKEYEETVNKARAVVKAIEQRNFFS
ncbi:MAG TPA: anthranilate synthase component I [Candidatus Omnitrophica bacterium]|nr:anthranilate synthase component I [Candidatus Omnitrophota bacterium]